MFRHAVRRITILASVILVAVSLAGCGVNNIPTYEQSAKAKWSEVLSQYKRRADLVPNLVETVKGFAAQEQNVLTSVIEARAKATQAQVQIPADIAHQSGGHEALPGRAELAGRRPATVAGRRRALSRHQVGPELPRPAVAARRHREPHRHRAARLHRGGARLQYRDHHLPGPHLALGACTPSAQPMATFDIPPQEMQTPRVDFGTKK